MNQEPHVLRNPPEKITNAYLKQFPEFVAFHGSPDSSDEPIQYDNATLEEALKNTYQTKHVALDQP